MVLILHQIQIIYLISVCVLSALDILACGQFGDICPLCFSVDETPCSPQLSQHGCVLGSIPAFPSSFLLPSAYAVVQSYFSSFLLCLSFKLSFPEDKDLVSFAAILYCNSYVDI